jgi:hypothetical protein
LQNRKRNNENAKCQVFFHFFHFYKRGITGRTFLNVFLLGFQIRIIKYKKFKEISIEELKNLINEKQKLQ